jgi:hypothetical protein
MTSGRVFHSSSTISQSSRGNSLKLNALLLSTILVLQFNLQLVSQASPINFTPSSDSAPATMQGQLPVNKVGALLAADCLAILNGNEIKIQQNQGNDHDPKFKKSKPSAPNKPDLFKGEILKSKIESTGDNKTVSGIAYFNSGTQFDRLTRIKCDDKVTLTDGQELSGIIQSADKIQLSLKTANAVQSIKISDIAAIHSARAFNFSMPVPPNTDVKNPAGFSAELGRLTLIPTCHVIAAGITSSSKKKRVLIIATTLTLLATSIAVPIALSCATHHHHTTPFRPIAQQPQTTLQVTPLTPVTKVVRPITVLGTKTATEAVPPTYSNTFTQVFVPPVFGARGRLIQPGYSSYVLVQKYLGRF